jgi:ribonuclease HI
VVGEGIIINPKGNVENIFYWDLGRALNNQAEALAMYQGLRIIDDKVCKKLIIIGDLKLIIKSMLKVSSPSN